MKKSSKVIISLFLSLLSQLSFGSEESAKKSEEKTNYCERLAFHILNLQAIIGPDNQFFGGVGEVEKAAYLKVLRAKPIIRKGNQSACESFLRESKEKKTSFEHISTFGRTYLGPKKGKFKEMVSPSSR